MNNDFLWFVEYSGDFEIEIIDDNIQIAFFADYKTGKLSVLVIKSFRIFRPLAKTLNFIMKLEDPDNHEIIFYENREPFNK